MAEIQIVEITTGVKLLKIPEEGQSILFKVQNHRLNILDLVLDLSKSEGIAIQG
jgi:UPF0288 family protein (methanogenesis marker protein 3)